MPRQIPRRLQMNPQWPECNGTGQTFQSSAGALSRAASTQTRFAEIIANRETCSTLRSAPRAWAKRWREPRVERRRRNYRELGFHPSAAHAAAYALESDQDETTPTRAIGLRRWRGRGGRVPQERRPAAGKDLVASAEIPSCIAIVVWSSSSFRRRNLSLTRLIRWHNRWRNMPAENECLVAFRRQDDRCWHGLQRVGHASCSDR